MGLLVLLVAVCTALSPHPALAANHAAPPHHATRASGSPGVADHGWYCRRCRAHADHGGRCHDCGALLVRATTPRPHVPHWNSYAKSHPYLCGRCRHWFEHGGRCPDCGALLVRREGARKPAVTAATAHPVAAAHLPAYHCSRCSSTSDAPGRCHDCGALMLRYREWARRHAHDHHHPTASSTTRVAPDAPPRH